MALSFDYSDSQRYRKRPPGVPGTFLSFSVHSTCFISGDLMSSGPDSSSARLPPFSQVSTGWSVGVRDMFLSVMVGLDRVSFVRLEE